MVDYTALWRHLTVFIIFQLNLWDLTLREMFRFLVGHEPLTRYVKLQVAHTPGMPGTFSPPLTSKETATERSRHASRHVRHTRTVMHVGIANRRWWGQRSWHFWRMHNPQFYVSGKTPILIGAICLQQMCLDVPANQVYYIVNMWNIVVMWNILVLLMRKTSLSARTSARNGCRNMGLAYIWDWHLME